MSVRLGFRLSFDHRLIHFFYLTSKLSSSHLKPSIRRTRRAGCATPEADEEVSGIHNVKLYKYKELQGATNDFSPINKIGQGGFGSVYQGKLKDGKIAAIKVLSAESSQGVNEFLAEINAIAEIQHENLVSLYGCCVEKNHRLLIYNYMENNSLARTLLGPGHLNHSIQFSWKTRVGICIGVARGLAFLHEEVRPHIIHRDIKASNILLDKDLTPKIADFGLAKLFPDNVTHVSTRVAGTIGYLAPEYAVRGRLTRKADIYSFGVLLVEIVSGRHNVNSRLPMGERFVLERAWDYYERNELTLLIDDALDGCYDVDEACRFLKIALLCTQDNPKLRPSMSTVVKMLAGEVSISNKAIERPGLISDLTELKVRNDPEERKTDERCAAKTTNDFNISSSSETMDNSGLSLSLPSTFAAMSFSSHDRSI